MRRSRASTAAFIFSGHSGGFRQVAQHGGQDAAVLVVVHFDGRVQAGDDGEGLDGAVVAIQRRLDRGGDGDRQRLARLNVVRDAGDVVGLVTSEAEAGGG